MNKFHLRVDSINGSHTRFTVFVNGANAGSLCMDYDEALNFAESLKKSSTIEVECSGFDNPKGK